ncbi:NAD(P)(+) transhydrogenase [Capsulimonas corticalis]|uniref:NAD(P)(+) transhydrogenase (Si-specific) n=1 Tax=Capsulimonas corticalis TaxID=2219043 RepID=A0A402D229_9BACT|nr:Si-specific NAD(P)(+) transhydrogenase [Capsulimonas corticalis]BDI30149.1 NAD(P)(+) transhydrogenase [Capsulimonas corticalis]
MKHVNMVVIGSGPAGQKAAIQAAKLGKSVILIEKNNIIGGACIHTGTIPSKALRESVLQLTGIHQSTLNNHNPVNKSDITLDDLIFRCHQVIRTEIDVIREHMQRNGVEMIWGEAHFKDQHTIDVVRPSACETIEADHIVIASGTTPARPSTITFDNERVLDSDSFLRLPALPKSIIIVGGGVIGTEYACMMAALGIRVVLVEARPMLLEFADSEIIEALQYRMRAMGVTLRLNERVDDIRVLPDGLVQATMQSGKHIRADSLLYCIGRQGATAKMDLDKVGLTPDSRGRLKVNEHYQTEIPHIYAVGDVIGFPALASTSMEQGRLASCHAYGEPTCSIPELFPVGIYSIPEISMVGKTEAALTDEGIPYEAGVAQYREIARGQLLGDEGGMLKLLIHEQTRQILGVHAIGTGATELIHIGQAVMALKGTVDYFINNVFNYPTLAECYKVAALNGSNKLRLLQSSPTSLETPKLKIVGA